jgi:hypothetical protein
MLKWYAIMAKHRKEQTSTSFLEHAGIEAYYPEVNECLLLREDDACDVRAVSSGTSLRGLTTASSIGRYPILRGVRKIVVRSSPSRSWARAAR